MSKEELLAMLQEKGLSDDDIKLLLKDTLDTLEVPAEPEEEAEQADADAEAASKLLGVDL